MVKWEYLTLQPSSNSRESPYVQVGTAERQVLAQQRQSLLQKTDVQVAPSGNIVFKGYPVDEQVLLDALGDLGWELVGITPMVGDIRFPPPNQYHFKRPRGKVG